MNLKQLEFFVRVAEEKNISLAARKLNIAQPPLSRQISMLEKELGVDLIRRNNRGIELTEAGQVLYEKSRYVIKCVNEMKEMVLERDKGECGQLRIGTNYSGLALLMEKIQWFSKLYPEVSFDIRLGRHNELMEALETGELDVVYLYSPSFERDNLRYHVLYGSDMVLIMPAALDPAPGESSISLDDLRNIPMCMMNTNGKFWVNDEMLLNECRRHGFLPRIVAQCNTAIGALPFINGGVAAALLPQDFARRFSNQNIIIKNIEGFSAVSYPTLVWNDNTYVTRTLRLFLSLYDIQTSVDANTTPDDDNGDAIEEFSIVVN